MIPLEAGRVGAVAIGIDLSPVATLAGRLLADYPLRDWSNEVELPFHHAEKTLGQGQAFTHNPRLVCDVRTTHAEVGRRVAERVERYYPRNAAASSLGGTSGRSRCRAIPVIADFP